MYRATPSQLNQIKGWVADFRKGSVNVEAVVEIGLERFDLYLVVMAERRQGGCCETSGGSTLDSLVVQAAFTPCIGIGRA